MFKAAKALRSSLIRNFLKSFVVSPLIRKFQERAVRAICIRTLTKEIYGPQRTMMEKLLEDNEHIVFFFVHYCYGEIQESKSRDEEK